MATAERMSQREEELEEARHQAKLLRPMERVHHQVQAQDQWRKGIGIQSKASQAATALGKAKHELNVFETSVSTLRLFWPVLAGILVILFFLGPGLLAVMTLINAINIWVWVGLIFIGILMWRNKR
jgi:hypothetical protein